MTQQKLNTDTKHISLRHSVDSDFSQTFLQQKKTKVRLTLPLTAVLWVKKVQAHVFVLSLKLLSGTT